MLGLSLAGRSAEPHTLWRICTTSLEPKSGGAELAGGAKTSSFRASCLDAEWTAGQWYAFHRHESLQGRPG